MSVSRTVSVIFSIKEWREQGSFKVIENGAVYYTTFCWSAIISTDLSCIVFLSYLMLNNIVTLKSGL